jgi:hypothetical protein
MSRCSHLRRVGQPTRNGHMFRVAVLRTRLAPTVVIIGEGQQYLEFLIQSASNVLRQSTNCFIHLAWELGLILYTSCQSGCTTVLTAGYPGPFRYHRV